MDGVNGGLPASSRLSPLTLEASNTLLPPLRSHGQQLGKTSEEHCQQINRFAQRLSVLQPSLGSQLGGSGELTRC